MNLINCTMEKNYFGIQKQAFDYAVFEDDPFLKSSGV